MCDGWYVRHVTAGGLKVADVQCEKGYTKIADELLEAFASTPLTGAQRRIIDVVLRETYGWDRKEHPLTYKDIASASGMSVKTVQKWVPVLLEWMILKRDSNGRIGLQKDYDLWIAQPKKRPTEQPTGTQKAKKQSKKKSVNELLDEDVAKLMAEDAAKDQQDTPTQGVS